ncbi:MAG TPA: energy transducer TonB, partial [Rhodanobacteraceae bacterium]|nr:energy transducer TonB [Rhodanobacteraceae bacterium]
TPVEVGMVVTGSVTVNPDGSVKAYTIDHADQLPPAVQRLLKSSIPGWTFDAIKSTGTTGPTKAQASVYIGGMVTETTKQIVDGKKVQQNTIQIGVEHIALHCPPPHAERTFAMGCDPDTGLTRLPSPPPEYPIEAARAHMEGVVDLRLEIGRNGRVLRAAVRQVNLFNRIPNPVLFRRIFSDVTLETAQAWRFRVPTTGPNAGRDRWVLAQQVKFYIMGGHVDTTAYGQWLADLPGPIKAIPWAEQDSGRVVRLPEMSTEGALMR